MLEHVTQTRSRWRTFWPEVDDLSGANEAIQLSSWFAFLAAGLGATGAVVTMSGSDFVPGLVGAAILALIGVGLRRRWRAAAVVGALAMGGGVVTSVANGALPGVIETLTFVALLSGVRGTFAHARLIKSAAVSIARSDSGSRAEAGKPGVAADGESPSLK